MIGLLQDALAMPTVLFTAGLIVALIYWAFVLVGALDADGGDLGIELDGAADGALDGALEGAAEGAVDGVLDGATDGVIEGATDGVLDGAADSASEAASGFFEGLTLGSLLGALGLRKAPITVSFSFLMLYGWGASAIAVHFLAPMLEPGFPAWLVRTGIFFGSVVVALPLTSLITRPLGPLFVTQEAERRTDLLGRTCRVDTGSVDGKFGQATIEENGAWTVIQVRSFPDNGLGRGDEALIISYDDDLEAFRVEPLARRAASHAGEVANPQSRAPPGAALDREQPG